MEGECERCGVCCIAGMCNFGKPVKKGFDLCKYLFVYKDHSTACTNKKAKRMFVGSGCHIRKMTGNKNVSIYDELLELRDYTSIKEWALKHKSNRRKMSYDKLKRKIHKCHNNE